MAAFAKDGDVIGAVIASICADEDGMGRFDFIEELAVALKELGCFFFGSAGRRGAVGGKVGSLLGRRCA